MSALLTTYSQFVGSINIPNASPSNSEGEALAGFISELEPSFVATLIGNELYSLIKEALTPPEDESGRIFNLINGADFTDKYGRINRWCGFKEIGTNPIAYFIYHAVTTDKASTTTGIGEKSLTAENMIDATSSNKLKNAWNKMVDLNSVLHDFLMQNATIYPEYNGIYGTWEYGNYKLFKKITNFY